MIVQSLPKEKTAQHCKNNSQGMKSPHVARLRKKIGRDRRCSPSRSPQKVGSSSQNSRNDTAIMQSLEMAKQVARDCKRELKTDERVHCMEDNFPTETRSA